MSRTAERQKPASRQDFRVTSVPRSYWYLYFCKRLNLFRSSFLSCTSFFKRKYLFFKRTYAHEHKTICQTWEKEGSYIYFLAFVKFEWSVFFLNLMFFSTRGGVSACWRTVEPYTGGTAGMVEIGRCGTPFFFYRWGPRNIIFRSFQSQPERYLQVRVVRLTRPTHESKMELC